VTFVRFERLYMSKTVIKLRTKSVFVLSHFCLNLSWPFRYRYRNVQKRSGAVVPGLRTLKCGGGGGRKIKRSE